MSVPESGYGNVGQRAFGFRIPTPEIDAALEVADDWQRKDKVLTATFKFGS